MKAPATELMKSASMPVLLALLMVLSSLAGCIFGDDENGSNGEVLAVFSYSPSSNIRANDTISFDASS
jgi:hypothetical protein